MKIIQCFALTAIAVCGAFTTFAQTWAVTSAPTTNYWTSVASSADGSKLVAAGNFYIFTSANFGATWQATTAPGGQWVSVASSADGMKLAAAVGYYGGSIYTSTNSGATWQASSAPATNWVSIACSADGATLIAAAGNGYEAYDADGVAITIPGLIYISTDSGSTWTPTSAPSTNWQAVACSADGSKLVAVVTGAILINGVGYETDGLIYTSTNSGLTWTPSTAPIFSWNSVASSTDGTKLVAAGNLTAYGGAGLIYTSTDSGNTWMSNNVPSLKWQSVASSMDGNKLAAVVYLGTIYTSPSELLLGIAPSSTNLVFSWTANATNFVLQQSSDLSSWADMTNQPILNLTNLQNQVVLPLPDGDIFFRLKTP